MKQEKKEVNLNHLIDELVETFQFQLTQKNLTLVKEIKCTSIMTVPAVLKYQVLSNLLSNAIKFSIPGQEIVIYSESSAQYHIIKVTNTALEENLKRLQNFNQDNPLSSTLGTFGEIGNGIGLEIAQNFATQYGGEIMSEVSNKKVSFIYRQTI